MSTSTQNVIEPFYASVAAHRVTSDRYDLVSQIVIGELRVLRLPQG